MAGAVSERRHIYQHRLRTVECIEAGTASLRQSATVEERTSDHLRTGVNNRAFIFRINRDSGLTGIYDLEGLAHEGQPNFCVFAGGGFCLGWQGDRKVHL